MDGLIDWLKAAACLLAPIVLLVLALLLSGCATATTPAPAEGDFQARLHRTSGTTQLSAQERVQGGQAGAADGCTLTVIGEVPDGVQATLKTGECSATVGR